MAKKIVKTNLTAVLLAVIGIMGYSIMADAGNLEPSAGPGSTMKSLDEIFGTVDSLASGRLTYPEKLWIDAFFPPVSAPFLRLQIDGNDVPGESPFISYGQRGYDSLYRI